MSWDTRNVTNDKDRKVTLPVRRLGDRQIGLLVLLLLAAPGISGCLPPSDSSDVPNDQIPGSVYEAVTNGPAKTPSGTRVSEAVTLTGKVVTVLDGDTIDILTPDREEIRVRFHGIDAPES